MIASSAKGNVDAITDGENGFLFDYDDGDSLKKTIEKAYRLKNDGWLPEFKVNDADSRRNEVLSYYKI